MIVDTKQNDKQIHNRIVLMDLNVALSSNFGSMYKYGFEDFVKNHENYRQWMVELLRNEYVILITARNIKWAIPTLKRISDKTDWQPNVALFNDTGFDGKDAPKIKEHQMLNHVFQTYGEDPNIYHAIESNAGTRAMYKRLGIPSVHDCARYGRWKKLPF